MSATISRCFGGHVDEARALMASAQGTPGHTHMVTVLPSGAWLVSLTCSHCGSMWGYSAPPASAQAGIDDWQRHVIECRGEAS